MQIENDLLGPKAGIDILELKRMLDSASLESVVIHSGQIIEKPIVAQRVIIHGGNIREMILARVITIAKSDAIVEKGGMLVCGKIFHDCSHQVVDGNVFAGKEFFKLGTNCCNYNCGNGCDDFLVLGEGE
jgi:hypothetical protein